MKGPLPTRSASGRSRARAEKASPISRAVLALRTSTFTPMSRAATSTSLKVASAIDAWAGLINTAIRTAPGTNSRRSPSRFAARSAAKKLTPVRLPPGRARLATSPSLTGSLPVLKTIVIVPVAALATSAEGVSIATMTATCRRTRSTASAGSRSVWFSAQRYSIVTLSPSTKPVSCRPWRNLRNISESTSGDWL